MSSSEVSEEGRRDATRSLLQVSGLPVKETWLVLPVAGVDPGRLDPLNCMNASNSG